MNKSINEFESRNDPSVLYDYRKHLLQDDFGLLRLGTGGRLGKYVGFLRDSWAITNVHGEFS